MTTDSENWTQRMERALEKGRRIVAKAEERRKRAAVRLADYNGPKWHFAILALQTRVKSFEFKIEGTMLASLKRVEEPANFTDLQESFQDARLVIPVARYVQSIEHELEVDRDVADRQNSAPIVASWIFSALRVRTEAEILVPCAASYPWSTLAAIDDRSCETMLLEDVPQASRLSNPESIRKADLDWVSQHCVILGELYNENPAFRLA